MKETKYTHRLIARVVVEAATPIAIGTGDKNILTDAPVVTDINGLPFIPGSSIAGVLRHAMKLSEQFDDSNPFGYQKGRHGHGSCLIFTDAVMVGKDGKALDGIQNIDWNDDFYRNFKELPIRQHADLNECGSVCDTGKFDNQVVYKGTRFAFEIEYVHDGNGVQTFKDLLQALKGRTLRIGSGAHNGLGELEIIRYQVADLDLRNQEHLDAYLSKTACLADDFDLPLDDEYQQVEREDIDIMQWTHYKLKLTPDSFFIFGSGHGDNDADMTSVSEGIVTWNSDNQAHFEKDHLLIPATSVKGALAHRTAYHWNKITGRFADAENDDCKVGGDNPAVCAIFGRGGSSSDEMLCGNIIMSDIIEVKPAEKVLNHVAIDRFTGGALEGALFFEKVAVGFGKTYEMNIFVKNMPSLDNHEQEALEDALIDLCKGLLPLGGGVNRGNGMFTGTLYKNEQEIFNYENNQES